MSHIASRTQFTRDFFSGWISLAAEIIVAFVLTPYIVHKLGAANYGVWSLMFSVIGYLGLIDIGIRGSVEPYINHCLALKDQLAVSEVVGTSTVNLTLLSLVVGPLAAILAANFSNRHVDTWTRSGCNLFRCPNADPQCPASSRLGEYVGRWQLLSKAFD